MTHGDMEETVSGCLFLNTVYIYRACKKTNTPQKNSVSLENSNFFAKLTVLTEEDHIFCKFHCNIWLHSKTI